MAMRYYMKLSSLLSSPKVITPGVIYGFGLTLLLLSCYACARISDLRNTSWTDGFNFPIVGLSFIICMVAPYFTPCRKRDKWRLAAIGFAGFVVIFALCALFYTTFVSA